MILRRITAEDSVLVWQWRNDPVSRLMFRNNSEIPWAEHVAWLEAALRDGQKLLLMAEDEGSAASIIRFDRLNNEAAEVSVNVDPERRGHGIGTRVLQLACPYAFAFWEPDLQRIFADIRIENSISRSAFTRAGFEYHSTIDSFCQYVLTKPSKAVLPEGMMGFSENWNECYRKGGQAIQWPWSDVVSLVMRHARPLSAGFRVLELGCGSGANIPFFKSLGCEYYSVEGSEVILAKLYDQHPDLKKRIVQGDFTVSLPFKEDFDLIIDRGSLTTNTTIAIKNGLANVHGKLKPSGQYIGVDWFSTSHPDYQRGQPKDDDFTRTGFEDGVFAHLGPIHFSDKQHLMDLFDRFEFSVLQHKVTWREIPEHTCESATWNIVTKKRQ